MLISAPECYWRHGATLRSAHDHSWALMDIHKHPWALLSTHGHSLAALSTRDPGARSPRALVSAHENWWAWRHVAMSTYEHTWCHDTILMNAQECSRVPKRAQMWSLGLRSAPDDSVSSIILKCLIRQLPKKCWFLKWPPCSILPITPSRFDQIIWNWIF